MVTKNQINSVFNGEGFLSNYNSNKLYFSTCLCGIIELTNPVKLYQRVLEFDYFYDKCFLDKLITAKIDIREDKNFVFSSWDNKIYNSDELWQLVQDNTWTYVDYKI